MCPDSFEQGCFLQAQENSFFEAAVTEATKDKETKERAETDKLKEGGNDFTGGAFTI